MKTENDKYFLSFFFLSFLKCHFFIGNIFIHERQKNSRLPSSAEVSRYVSHAILINQLID